MNARRLSALAALVALPMTALTQVGASADGERASDRPDTRTVAASALADTTPSAPRPSARKPKVATKATKVSLRVMPQIAQPGAKPAAASAARSAAFVQVQPKRRTAVTLQVKVGKKWKAVSSAATDPRGQHVFHAAARHRGKAATYRVTVGKKKSAAASTQPWLSSKFTDDFSGTELSSSWQHRKQHFEPASGRTCSRGSTKAVTVSGGTVRLSVLKDTEQGDAKCTAWIGDRNSGKFAYRLNGHISTESSMRFKYGFAAVRARFPKSQGQHGSFWLQPSDEDRTLSTDDPKQTGAEIDVIESFGANGGPSDSRGLSSFTYHWQKIDGRMTPIKTGGYLRQVPSLLQNKKDNVHDRYHVFSVEWTPTSYVFRIDGKESWRSSVGVSGVPQYPILSLLSSDYELERLEGGDKNLPQHMHVDWIRVWETGS